MAGTHAKESGKRRAQPERTCIGCRRVRAKRELARIIRTPTGTLEIDWTGKRSGRGVYLCRERSCWETGFKGNALEHHLRLPERISPDVRQRLLQEGTAALILSTPVTTGQTVEIIL